MDPLTIPPFMLPLVVNAIVLLITLIYGCIEDIKERAVPVVMWYPMLIIAIPSTIWFWYSILQAGYLPFMMPFIPLILFFVVMFYLFTRFHLMGMADTKAFIWITVLLPCFPLVPLYGYSPLGNPPFVFFPFSVLFNAVILNLITPIGIFLMNLLKGNRAPLPYLFLGFPVDGKTIEDQFGIVMEEITEQDGVIERRFIRIGLAIRDMISGGKRVYTKSLKEDPKAYEKERALYAKCEMVWISYGVPFLIPITAGLLSAIFIGDLFVIFLSLFTG